MASLPYNQSNVLILSSDTGGGHRSAALALEDSFTTVSDLIRQPIAVTTRKVLEESTQFNRRLVELYNYLLRDHQNLMKYYYWAINHLKPNEMRLILEPMIGYGKKMVHDFTPNVVVSVHPMVQHFYALLMRRLGLLGKIPLVTVVTDPCYGFWRGWASQEVSKYYVASEGAFQQLVEYGIDPTRIEIQGMPVHRRFQPVSENQQRAIRQELDLNPDAFTVFVNAGWIGGGNIPTLFQELIQADLPGVQYIFLTGKNEQLRQEAQAFKSVCPNPVSILGYTSSMESLMNASDIMISKLGGLTTFEALACGLPIMADCLTPPMPQEANTSRYLEETGAGHLIHTPDALIGHLSRLIQTPDEYRALKETALN